MKTYFITGTDTDCGKTYVTCQILDHFNELNQQVYALKPVASGSFIENDQLYNQDIISLQQHNRHSNYPINKWQFLPAISPHLAAKQANDFLCIEKLANFCSADCYQQLDYLFIEGAGGLLAPLNDQHSWLDFLIRMEIPVIVVVGIKLGCINHALLTDVVLNNSQIECAGWIANCLDKDMLALQENIETLRTKMSMPLIATIPYKDRLNGGFSLNENNGYRG